MRIGVLCSGGDAPGMNPCIRAIVRAAGLYHHQVVGIRHGYQGLLDGNFRRGDGNYNVLGARDVSGLTSRGGTILHSSRCPEFATPEGNRRAAEMLTRHEFDALIVIGGNGSLAGALDLSKVWKGQIIGLPGTIDNDLLGTDATIGFPTAIQTAVEAIDKLRDTAGSHDMMFLVEVMGRHCGDLALRTAVAAGCEIVAVPEIPTSIPDIVKKLKYYRELGKRSMVMVVAEGDDLGGAYEMLKALKEGGSPYEMRVVVLGHVQRGGVPCPADRLLAAKLGVGAIEALERGETGKMLGFVNAHLKLSPLEEVIASHREVTDEMMHLLDALST